MLKNYDGGWVNKGIRPQSSAVWISHFPFVDDYLILKKVDPRSANCLNETLQTYCLNSGQSANKLKNSIFSALIVVLLLEGE